MRDDMTEQSAARGGCQCGAVRYEVAAGPKKASVCHCRMCQRATGNAFAPLLEVPTADVTWHGTPATWASSNISDRGFCATCGTPLFFRDRDGDTTEFMAGSLSGFDYRPVYNCGIEARMPWLAQLNDLPERETRPEAVARVVSHQAPEAG
ncbi:GFA family protein [Rhodobacter sp. CZR27]|uniref:GFA family protein n=1 Tax=Rhodobacter sp. CZR27 TaxID=2033869 RepID=UPI000BBF388D|nr:GFA family protein [Rhodobacter sp. CZR27]